MPTQTSSKLRNFWGTVGVALILVVFYLSLRPEQATGMLGEGGGRLEHGLAYGVLMFWFAHLESDRRGRLRLALGLVGMGVMIECLQGMLGHRTFSVADMGANSLGVLIGCLAAPPRVPNLLEYLEARAWPGKS
jgi:hypothetical protein